MESALQQFAAVSTGVNGVIGCFAKRTFSDACLVSMEVMKSKARPRSDFEVDFGIVGVGEEGVAQHVLVSNRNHKEITIDKVDVHREAGMYNITYKLIGTAPLPPSMVHAHVDPSMYWEILEGCVAYASNVGGSTSWASATGIGYRGGLGRGNSNVTVASGSGSGGGSGGGGGGEAGSVAPWRPMGRRTGNWESSSYVGKIFDKEASAAKGVMSNRLRRAAVMASDIGYWRTEWNGEGDGKAVAASEAATADLVGFSIPPGHGAIIAVGVAVGKTASEKNIDRSLVFHTSDGQELTIGSRFLAVRGSVKMSPSMLTFAPSFPGKLSRRPLYVSNTIERAVVLDSVKSSNPAFSVVLTTRVVEAKSKNVEIGYVDFHPGAAASSTCERRHSRGTSKSCDPFDFDTEDNFGKPVNVKEYKKFMDLNKRFGALMNSEGTVEKTTLSLKTSVTMRVSTVDALASLAMPNIVRGDHFKIPTMQVYNYTSVYELARASQVFFNVSNPSDKPLKLQLVETLGDRELGCYKRLARQFGQTPGGVGWRGGSMIKMCGEEHNMLEGCNRSTFIFPESAAETMIVSFAAKVCARRRVK